MSAYIKMCTTVLKFVCVSPKWVLVDWRTKRAKLKLSICMNHQQNPKTSYKKKKKATPNVRICLLVSKIDIQGHRFLICSDFRTTELHSNCCNCSVRNLGHMKWGNEERYSVTLLFNRWQITQLKPICFVFDVFNLIGVRSLPSSRNGIESRYI